MKLISVMQHIENIEKTVRTLTWDNGVMREISGTNKFLEHYFIPIVKNLLRTECVIKR